MGQRKTILLIDDADDLRAALCEQFLMTEEFIVTEATTAIEALQLVKNTLFDLLVLDFNLPDTNGQELCRLMRKKGLKTPVIMLTGHTSDVDTILELEVGANDYIRKPFKFSVLLARIRTQLRQHEQSEDGGFILGPYSFEPALKLLVTEDERKIRLTEKETNILQFLHRAPTNVVPRETLLQEVWGYSAAITTHTLETHIYRLRQKIELDPRNALLLTTESGGYRLNI